MTYVFTTDEGVAVPTVSVDQMRDIDRIAAGNETPNLYQMMENAGLALARAATALLGNGWNKIPISVLVGPGSNGGGGAAAARHLANRGGDITVIVTRDPTPGSILEQQLGIYAETPGRLGGILRAKNGLILDALVGYGLNGEPQSVIAEMISAINEADAPIISLDVPSGRDADTGRAPGVAVVPTETLTLALPKSGLEVAATGEIFLADLGIPAGVYRRLGLDPSPRIFAKDTIVHLRRSLS